MNTRLFTAGILTRGGKVLVLRRKEDDDTYPGMWDCVGGHFEEGESAEACMSRELTEESGLRAKILKTGPLIEYRDGYGRSIAVPYLLESRSGRVKLSEHTEFSWVPPAEARTLKAVPVLNLALDGLGL